MLNSTIKEISGQVAWILKSYRRVLVSEIPGRIGGGPELMQPQNKLGLPACVRPQEDMESGTKLAKRSL
jgi:hypothetical protein